MPRIVLRFLFALLALFGGASEALAQPEAPNLPEEPTGAPLLDKPSPPEKPTGPTTLDKPALPEELESEYVNAESGASPLSDSEEDYDLEEFLDDTSHIDMENDALQIYGFADTMYRNLFFPADSPWALNLQDNSTFLVGNLNLYVRANISTKWSSLTEVRFSFFPNGAQRDGFGIEMERQNTTFRDDADPADTVRVGGIIIERAWLEYRYSEYLQVRFGRWLTPYGIWNIDHGSPTLIGTRKPFIIGLDLMPSAQTGIQLHGEYRTGEYRLKYFATVANGRGPFDEYRDLDGNKALGLSFKLETPWLDEATIGGASNYGRSSINHPEATVTGTSVEDVMVETRIDEESNVLTLSADLKLRWKNLLFAGELVSEQIAYTERGRPQHFAVPGTLQPDSTTLGWYGLLGYELPWQNAMVWGVYESATSNRFGVNVHMNTGGITLRPLPKVTLKATAFRFEFREPDDGTSFLPSDSVFGTELQIAWVF